MQKHFRILLSLLMVCTVPFPAFADTPFSSLEQIAKASLEDLMNMTVTSVSKIPEEFRKVSAPLYVITAEDIRRRGVTSVPEALRMVPGVNVARMDANKWAVSIRGFNGRGANKLLVLIDGRTVYDPLFSGTLWETRDVVLEDVERIEVIRGPGGSTWGANAVNGVINIITKHTKDTLGGLVSGGGGNEERGFGTVRYGGELSEHTSYRVYSKYNNRDSGFLEDGASDDSRHGQAGFRMDSVVSRESTVGFQGTFFDGNYDGATGSNNNVDSQGAALQGRWDWQHDKDGRFSLNGFFEDFEFDNTFLGEERDTLEISLQEQQRITDWFDLIAGAQYRHTADQIKNSEVLSLDPDERDDDLYGASLAGKFELIKEQLELRVGTKVERNDYTDTEVQPDMGLSWSVDEKNTLWTSVSKAVRVPSRLEDDFIINLPAPGQGSFVGNNNTSAEELIAYQAGYRTLLAEDVLLFLSAFYNDYDELIVAEGNTVKNSAEGSSHGFEAGTTWAVNSWWTMKGAYSYLNPDLDVSSGSGADPSVAAALEGNSPRNQVFFMSSFDLSDRWQIDMALRYVDSLAQPRVSNYTVADFRVGFRATEDLDLSLVAQNLFDRHFEQSGTTTSQVEEGIFGKVTWRFN